MREGDKLIARQGPRQVSRYDAMWRKLFGIKGEGPELLPVIGLQNGYDDLELGFIRGETPGASFQQQPASAANLPHVGICIIGGPTPQYIMRVEQLVLWSDTAQWVLIGLRTTSSGVTNTAAQNSPRDSRQVASALNPVNVFRYINAAALISAGLMVQLQANIPVWLPTQFVLTSGTGLAEAPSLVAVAQTVNTSLNAGFVYRFRTIEPEERNPS